MPLDAGGSEQNHSNQKRCKEFGPISSLERRLVPPIRFNQIEGCTGACLNAAAVYRVEIHLSRDEIQRYANYNGTTLSAMTAIVVAHEMGHALRLGNITPTMGTCSEAQDVMVEHPGVLHGCGITAPTSCDTTGINTVYPSAVGVCSVPYCYGELC